MKFIKYFIIVLFSVSPIIISGQSIYSSIGVGEMQLHSTTRAKSLGISGVAFTDLHEISLINPALWHVPRLTGLSIQMQSTAYNYSSGYNNYFDFDGFNFHFPLADRFGFAIGFSPYSYVGYEFERDRNFVILPDVSVTDTIEYNATQSGTGGVGAAFGGFGWRITNNLSVGAALSALIGQIDVKRRFEVTEPPELINRTISSISNLFGTNIIAGMAYANLLKESDNLGVRVEIPLSLLIQREDDYLTGEPVQTEFSDLLWPWQISAGYSVPLTDRWLSAIEASMWMPEKDLTKFTLNETPYSSGDALQIGIGMEYHYSYESENWWDLLSWRTGIRWNQYMETNIDGEQPMGIEWIGGVGLPFNQGMNRLDISVFLGQRSGPIESQPTETRTGIKIGITVSEPWFRGGIRNN